LAAGAAAHRVVHPGGNVIGGFGCTQTHGSQAARPCSIPDRVRRDLRCGHRTIARISPNGTARPGGLRPPGTPRGVGGSESPHSWK
jgi:hypothetical protein